MITIRLKVFIFAITLNSFAALAQQLSHDIWTGMLDLQVQKLPLVLNAEKRTLDSPEQEAFGMPIDVFELRNDSLFLKVNALQLSYQGKIYPDSISGDFKQFNIHTKLIFLPGNYVKKEKPQTPKPPYNYDIEEVSFENPWADFIPLKGTFTKPASIENPPVVILVSGSGPQDRDATMFGHKLFWVMADYLSSNGVAVLRFDERGVGASQGVFATATTFDFAADVEAALLFLQNRNDIDHNRIGVIGHSEGGVIAPIVASRNEVVDFIVLLAGPGLNGEQVLLTQNEKILSQEGASQEQIAVQLKLLNFLFKHKNDQELKLKFDAFVEEVLKDTSEETQKIFSDNASALRTQLSSAWMKTFLEIDPKAYLQQLSLPVLVLQGEQDVQILPDDNLKAIEEALQQADTSYKIKRYPNLNHLFQTATTGKIAEYSELEETIAPIVLDDILNYIHGLPLKK
ncbi:MAG: alpha/beta hydrolase [Flavobacteriaceae bacterium]|nr:alpha/beta hydrolase [Flavobacteriaceae bacterium]